MFEVTELSVFEMFSPRQVISNDDGTFSIDGESFTTSDFDLARRVASQLDIVDPQYKLVSEEGYGRGTKKLLSHLRVGDKAWTLPRAMWQDVNRCYWLHPGFPADISPAGGFHMIVDRQNCGYMVRYCREDMKQNGVACWRPQSSSGFTNDQYHLVDWLPVVQRRPFSSWKSMMNDVHCR